MRARLAGPAVATLAMLAILVALGVWQLERRSWKLGILAQIDQAEASPPVPLPADPRPFTKVVAQGRLRTDLRAYYGDDVRDGPNGPVMGAQLIEPLERPGQPTVLVDRGWVPDGRDPGPGSGDIVGYVRLPDRPGLFSPANDPATRRFYTLDPAPIAAALGLGAVAPFTLIALGPSSAELQPASALPRPPNDHLNYALTWFGLALALLVVFAAYARKTLRHRGPP